MINTRESGTMFDELYFSQGMFWKYCVTFTTQQNLKLILFLKKILLYIFYIAYVILKTWYLFYSENVLYTDHYDRQISPA